MPNPLNSWKKCNNINTIDQIKGGDNSIINRKLEITNKACFNMKRYLLLSSSHKTNLWYLPFQCIIWILCRSEYIIRQYLHKFLRNNTRPYYIYIYNNKKLFILLMAKLKERSLINNLIIDILWYMLSPLEW